MKKAALLLAALLAFSPLASAQSKQETKWYNKTIEAGTVAAYDSFLRRYPRTVYRQTIDSLRHEALYVTHMTNAEATSIMGSLEPKLKSDPNQAEFFKAAPIRDEGRDFIVGVSVREEGMAMDTMRFYLSEKKNGIWQMPVGRNIEKPVFDSACIYTILMEEEKIVEISGEKWLGFTYRNMSLDGEKVEHVEALMPAGAYEFDNQEPVVVHQSFSGTLLRGNRIEGMMPEKEEGVKYSDHVLYLINKIQSNETLVQIAKEDMLTDQAVTWWLKNNPKAQTSATSIKFGVLPDSCSIVKYYRNNREKEHGNGWSAALFDIRGYTVVCAKSPSGNYTLIWCEPRFKNRSSDRILNSIYFDKNYITLFYYQGRRAFKYKINLSSKAILR